jgi:hypothetical protein
MLSILAEWGLSTQFAASDSFLNKWADAQKLAYSQGLGWIVSLDESLFQSSILIGCLMSST